MKSHLLTVVLALVIGYALGVYFPSIGNTIRAKV
jgi:uncharacterized protein YneF (UPF0154 family)